MPREEPHEAEAKSDVFIMLKKRPSVNLGFQLSAILGEGENPTGSAIFVLVQPISNLKIRISNAVGNLKYPKKNNLRGSKNVIIVFAGQYFDQHTVTGSFFKTAISPFFASRTSTFLN